MQRLHPALRATGVADNQLHEWTSHCFRRGSGIDMLQDKGVDALLSHGDWSTPRAAEPYASADEQCAAQLAASALNVFDISDDDE